MYFGLAISLVLHAGLIAWAIVNFHSSTELVLPEAPTIEAEIVSLSEFTRLKQGDPTSKELEAKAKENPEPQTAKKEAPKPIPETPEPPPAAEPPPAPEPAKPAPETAEKPEPPEKPDPIAQQLAALPPQPSPQEDAEKLEAERKAKEEAERKAKEEAAEVERKAKAEAERKKKEAEQKKKEAATRKKKEEERKKKLAEEKRLKEAQNKKSFSEQIAALIDKTPEERGAPRSSQRPNKPTDYEGPTAGERKGQGNELTAREADLLKGQISAQLRNCWRLPGGGGGIEAVVVTIRWRLREDGSLDGYPEVQNGRSDPVFQAAARAAIAAVTECAPFSLPRERYTAWRTIIWDFDPRHML